MRDTVATEGLLLRDLQTDDLDALLEVLGDPAAMRYYPASFDRDGVTAWIEWARRSYRENGFGLWAVIRRSDGRFLGDCGLMLDALARTHPRQEPGAVEALVARAGSGHAW